MKTILNLYSNLDSVHKLIMAFAISFICMCLIGYRGYWTAQAKVESVRVIIENNLKRVRWISIVRVDLNANRTNLYHAIANIGHSASATREYLDDIPSRAARIDKNLLAAEEKIRELSDEYLVEQITVLKNQLVAYRKGRARTIQLIKLGDQRLALQIAEN